MYHVADDFPQSSRDKRSRKAKDDCRFFLVLEHFPKYFSALPKVSGLNGSRLKRFHQIGHIIYLFKVNRRDLST